jgi:hypothetical protein
MEHLEVMVLAVVQAGTMVPEVVLLVVTLVAELETGVVAELDYLRLQTLVVELEHLVIPAILVEQAALVLLLFGIESHSLSILSTGK